MKKTLSLILALALMLGALGCAGVSAETAVEYPETVSVFTGLNEHLSKLGVTNYNETYYWQELEKRTGTHVDFQHLAAGADAMTQLNLMVASKTLTDVIVGIDWKTVTGGATLWEEDGVIIDLTDLIPEYMPNYYAAIQEVPYWEPTLSIDGKMYYISDIQHGVIYQGPNIRGDWLEAAGLEKPATLDELYTVLKYFKEHDMNGNGDVNDEWPMSGLAGNSIGWSPYNLMWAYGVHWSYQLVDGQVTHGMLLPEFTEAVSYLRKLYEEGLLDPDYATQDRTALDGKYMNNQVGMEYGIQPSKMNNTLNPDAVEGQFAAVGLPNLKLTADSPAYVFDNVYITLFTGAQAAITGACKEPEKVLHWIDYIYSDEGSLLFNYGLEHLSFEYDENGVPQIDYTGAIAANPDISATEGVAYLYSISGTSAFPEHMSSTRFKETMHPFSAAAADGWAADYDISRLLPTLALTAEQQEEINDKLVDLDTYITTQMDKLVNGQTSLDEIPAIQQKLKDMGIEDVLAAYQEVYDTLYADK